MAIESIDDNTIKLVYSCWQESVFYKNDRYIEAMNMRLIKEVIE